MRIPSKSRDLSDDEINLARSVFHSSLPPWPTISITDGLGIGDAPFTTDNSTPFFPDILGGDYSLNLGPDMYPDATLLRWFDRCSRYRDVFIHEMTHVWQYYYTWTRYTVAVSSLWTHITDKSTSCGYAYEVGKPWADYSDEQQAQLVEDWFHNGALDTDERFVYVDKIVRPGVSSHSLRDFAFSRLPADKLREMD
jgi:hypothetical protein